MNDYCYFKVDKVLKEDCDVHGQEIISNVAVFLTVL